MKRAIVPLLLTLAATVPAASPAQAAPPPVVPILSAACDGFIYPDTTGMAPGPRGRVHGFVNYSRSADCGNRIFYFEGAGASWTSGATSLRGTVVDVAQDATGTYLLYVIDELSETAELAVAKRAADGTVTRLAVLAPVAGTSGQGRGSIVARGGKWLAVWPQDGATAGDHDLYQYGTLYPGSSVRPVPVGSADDTAPALALAPDGSTVLAFTRRAAGSEPVVRVARTTDGAAWQSRTAATGVTTRNDFPDLELAVSTAGTFLAWSATVGGIPQVVVADDQTGRWRTQTELPAFLGSSWDPRLVADGARVMAGYSSGDEYPSDAVDIAKRTTAAGTWTPVPAGATPPSIDSRGVVGLAASGGRVTAVIFSGDSLYAATGLRW